MVFPIGDRPAVVELIRGGHRLPEFLPNGMSRWVHGATYPQLSQTLAGDLVVDRHTVPGGSVILISPGAIWRTRGATAKAVKVRVLPSRLSLLRFYKTAPRGELAHAS